MHHTLKTAAILMSPPRLWQSAEADCDFPSTPKTTTPSNLDGQFTCQKLRKILCKSYPRVQVVSQTRLVNGEGGAHVHFLGGNAPASKLDILKNSRTTQKESWGFDKYKSCFNYLSSLIFRILIYSIIALSKWLSVKNNCCGKGAVTTNTKLYS